MTDGLLIACSACGFSNRFPQPYRYHAGFGDTAFLYNEAGDCTLSWGIYDRAYSAFVGQDNAWHPTRAHQQALEAVLPLSPRGDRWLFEAPARCPQCAAPISAPMVSGEIYYLEYPGSVILGGAGLPSDLGSILIPQPST